MTSYTAARLGAVGRVQEVLSLYKLHMRNIPEQVRVSIERLREVEECVFANTGARLEHLTMLDIGPGQKLKQMVFFSARNQVIGVDLDVIPQSFDVCAYVRMAQRNGWLRVLKTLSRKACGIDGRYRRELARQLGLARVPRFRIHWGDAEALPFSDQAFDCVYSFSVFQSVPHPSAAVEEVVRVLRPGGIAYISVHNYTSYNGHGDPRFWTEEGQAAAYWPHLRRRYSDFVRCNAYLNRVRLREWKVIFGKFMPDVVFVCRQWGRDDLAPLLEALRAKNELTEFTNEELLTVDFVAVWRKPK